ncbi:MAG: CRTAC1 family protein [Armatimonadaceae bacterium]
MFHDHSDVLTQNPPMLGYGVCVTDIDQDGRFEFFVCGFGFPNRVLAWNGGQLTDQFDRTLFAYERQAIGVAAADLDGDGAEELYVLNTDTFAGAKRFGDNLFARRNGSWTDLFTLEQNADAINRTAGRSVCAVDRNGTGQYGFVVANYGGAMRFYERGDRDELYDVAGRVGIALVTGGRALASLPLVSAPGRMDIFAANENSPNFLFVNAGDGTFVEQAEELGLADPYEHGRGVAVLDADSNGRFDLAIGNWQGEHRLFLQSPLGGFLDAATIEISRPSAIRTVIAADFDNDGHEELFFNNIGEPNRLFGYRDGEWKRLDIGAALEPDGLGTGAAVADIDGDGRLELLISHGESDTQPLSFYRPEPNDNGWLRIRPLTRSGAPARGAVVTMTTADRVQRRVIDAGSGYLCQMEPVAHFGLGENRSVERIEVVFPGGAVATVFDPDPCQTLVVPFPG